MDLANKVPKTRSISQSHVPSHQLLEGSPLGYPREETMNKNAAHGSTSFLNIDNFAKKSAFYCRSPIIRRKSNNVGPDVTTL